MFDRIKGFFKRKDTHDNRKRSSKSHPIGKAKAKTGSSLKSKIGALEPLNLAKSEVKEVQSHIRKLRLELARARTMHRSGVSSEIKGMRGLKKQLAQAQSHLRRSV